ncbi:MAG TPA: DUF998 domain-containing protein [Anaerolineales bacterium]|nr:DUF998 domain-containing protein [Anaerolineales bacterium]
MGNRLFTIAVTYFIGMIVLAHFFTPPGYNWTENTISELASQGHRYKGIMQTGLIGFGAILIFGVFTYFRRNSGSYFLIFVAIYGLSIMLSGIYCTAPIDPDISFSVQESNLHSLFATIAGIGMSLGILWQVFASMNKRDRWIRIAFLVLIGGLSGLFGLAENGILILDKGIVQRVLYLVGLIWLVYEERKLTSHEADA